jgi:uncharacterized protein (TIGR00369 family)
MDDNRRFLRNHAFLDRLGVSLDHQERGEVRLSLPHADWLTNPGSDALQGGVVATLIDHAGGAALRSTLAEPLETPHATTDLNVSYLRPATDDLTAEATVLRAGQSMATVRVEVTASTPDGDSVAVGRVSLYLSRE